MASLLDLPDNYVINPHTHKKIRVGGPTYNRLLRQSQENLVPINELKKGLKNKPAPVVTKAPRNRDQAKDMIDQMTQEKPPRKGFTYALNPEASHVILKKKKATPVTQKNLTASISNASLEVQNQLMRDPVYREKLMNNSLTARDKSVIQNMINQKVISNNKVSVPVNKEQHDAYEDQSETYQTTQRRPQPQGRGGGKPASRSKFTRAQPQHRTKIFSDTDNGSIYASESDYYSEQPVQKTQKQTRQYFQPQNEPDEEYESDGGEYEEYE